ncbi:putative undecaprenyl-phosphate N-acetylglucosaminyl 1-phosphate transferase [bacterium BMS3Abin01]|nr:putative undecaprenyl-phosphate N-acetylglucosaminyl 1-phosphate transferase [bacterium BMS3Abin01]HDY69312.1 undecaprenyl/decaprenyl-phosphate alpha-N-acetylglucosaminyl 1-phosphate transferase [Actinomycetota bacterium]
MEISTVIEFFLRDETAAVFAFVLAAIIVLLITPTVTNLARRMGAMDQPDHRKIHTDPVPRLGGLAIFFGFIIPALLFLPLTSEMKGVLLGAVIITLFGAVDDFRGTGPLVKFAGQFIAAGCLVYYGIRIEFITLPLLGTIELGPELAIPLTLLWVVVLVNIFNFIDGMDGLAAGVCTIAAITFSIIAISMGRSEAAILAAILAGTTLGFLRYNFYPASIFMGDSGSMLLGFVLAAVTVGGVLKSVATVTLVLPLLILGIPIFDLSFAILRRAKNKRSIFQPDRGHLHHRLFNIGFSQRKAVLVLYAWVSLTSALALSMRFAPRFVTIILAVLVMAVSFYLIYLLEILKIRTRRSPHLR